jgi:crotonobetainyl-CoA:carnitine CoA-transferase CaiB-like acyl-CoA transferase
MPDAGGPLAGLRVIDLTWMLAGPYCTMLLADLGADVVKIEPPGGDPMRGVGPFAPGDRAPAYGGYFQSVNRGKRSVMLDLKSAQGLAALRQLSRSADVVVENFRAGVMDRLGVGYETLAAENERLVYAAVRGFGDPRTGASPYASRPAVDVTIQAMAGLMGITGPDARTPLKTGPGIGDIFPAVLLAVGILAACREVERSGRGQFLDVAMFDGVLSLCERIVYQYSYAGDVPAPQGNGHPLFCPFDLFPARDGHIAICASDDDQWRALCIAMERPELADDGRYATGAARNAHAAEVRAAVSGWTSGLDGEQIADAVGAEVPVGPVLAIDAIARDPHVRAREMIVELEQPGVTKPVAVAGLPIKLARTPGTVARRAPLLDEHREEILGALGVAIDRGRP